MIHVSLAFGPIEAYLDATFDALINFSPLHYTVDLSVSIGVTFDMQFLFVHIQYVHQFDLSRSCRLISVVSLVMSAHLYISKDQNLAVWLSMSFLSSNLLSC